MYYSCRESSVIEREVFSGVITYSLHAITTHAAIRHLQPRISGMINQSYFAVWPFSGKNWSYWTRIIDGNHMNGVSGHDSAL